jgi:hypothetical protein
MDAARSCANSPYTCPIMAGAGLSTTFALAVVDWTKLTGQATAALALAGLVGGGVVGGVVFVIRKYDLVKIERQKLYEDAKIERQKLYDDANKESISKQMAESIANQEKMRESLHALRNDATAAASEAANLRDDLATLREQFMSVSKELRETDRLLHAARQEMHATTAELQQTSAKLQQTGAELAVALKDRDALREELGVIRRSQVSQGQRIGALEQSSGPHEFPAPPAPEAPR